MKTAQEIFTQVATHLLTQNKRAVRDLECQYRLKNGCTCAIGCLIAEEHYSPELEGKRVFMAEVQRALRLSGVDAEQHAGLLRDLQYAHDREPVDAWAHSLRQLAVAYGLEMPCLT